MHGSSCSSPASVYSAPWGSLDSSLSSLRYFLSHELWQLQRHYHSGVVKDILVLWFSFLDTWVFVTMIQVYASCLWQGSVEICFDLLNIVAENRCEPFTERVELETRKTVYLFCAQLKEWIMIYRKNRNHWAKISEKRLSIPRRHSPGRKQKPEVAEPAGGSHPFRDN